MKNETAFEFPAWYLEFQTAVLKQLPRPGDIDQTTALGWERNQKALKKLLTKVLLPPKPTNLKLLQSNIIIPPLTETFDPEEKFRRNTKVKYFLGDNFETHLLNTTKLFSNLKEVCIDKSVLKRRTTDVDIMAETKVSAEDGLLSKEEILYRINYLTELQPEGGEGILNNTGEVTIVGYFKCDDGKIRVANVQCNFVNRGWNCNVEDLVNWFQGNEIFSSNGIVKT
jgi:hypothetical protein